MNRHYLRQVVFPLVAAIIWGTAFVFQSVSADYIEPFTFNALRSAVAAIFLALVLLGRKWLWSRRGARMGRSEPQANPHRWRDLLLGGFLCGTVLTVASNLQQLGLGDTSPGKAAFITALYVVLVPIFGLLLRKKVYPVLWISVLLAVVGLYFLCINGNMSMARSDFYVFLCALSFAVHILVIDHVSPRVDGIELSCVQFAVVALMSSIGMILTESPSLAAIVQCLGSVLYVGIFSSGVAYTLQILAQKNANPTVVSLLLSLESVFATIAAVLLVGQWMTPRETFGSVLVLVAVVLAQLPITVWQRLRCTKRRKQ